MFTSAQLRAARAMLRLEQSELAQRASVSVETVKRLEGMPDRLRGQTETLESIKNALELSGVVFDDDNFVGVKLLTNRNAPFIAHVVKQTAASLSAGLDSEFGHSPTMPELDREKVIERVVSFAADQLRKNLEKLLPNPRSKRPRKF